MATLPNGSKVSLQIAETWGSLAPSGLNLQIAETWEPPAPTAGETDTVGELGVSVTDSISMDSVPTVARSRSVGATSETVQIVTEGDVYYQITEGWDT